MGDRRRASGNGTDVVTGKAQNEQENQGAHDRDHGPERASMSLAKNQHEREHVEQKRRNVEQRHQGSSDR